MSYPQITLNHCDYAQITQNKTGDLAMVYKPLQNLVKNTTLGAFTTEKLNFNRYDAQDMLIVDEFDGSTNIIINDDTNQPRLINSGFSVQEDNTFLIPEHYTNTVTNIYDDSTFNEDTQLLKLYNKIPKLEFKGLGDGAFKCGSYVFYFRLSDSVGNMTNIIQHSSTVQVFIGENNSYKIRMGLKDENANKSINFKLTNIDSGFDYLRVFYERTSSGEDQANATLFYMIDQNFPIINGNCELTLTGEEQTLGISLTDLKNEYADIAACKTHTIVDNTLFLANTAAYVHDYAALQRIAWCIYPTFEKETIELPDTEAEGEVKGYYDPANVYSKVGYWPDEYYRFGIVFIYNNNQLSPVFNIQGYDEQKVTPGMNLLDVLLNRQDSKTYELPEFEPENYIFNDVLKANSKGVIRTKTADEIDQNLSVCFHLNGLDTYITHTNDLTEIQKDYYKNDIKKFLNEHHGIKGFFFVRQKRIPTIIAQGMVVGLTTKDYGSIPILQDGENNWKTQSFINKDRLILPAGSTILTYNEKDEDGNEITRVVNQALLVPDAELQEATFNQIFTSQEFTLSCSQTCKFNINEVNDQPSCWWEYDDVESKKQPQPKPQPQLVKLTAVPKDTTVKTNGTDYFSTLAGSAEEAFKTKDILHNWERTLPQDLTQSSSLIRGRWGYYVGMNKNSFNFGDIVTIKKSGFGKNAENQNDLEFQSRFSDNSFYSPVSTRYSVEEIKTKFKEFNGDCFPSMFTHRMMTNFIDPELPTNDKIVHPGCWCENYAVRCTAEILEDTSSNLVGESAGFYLPSPNSKTSAIASLIFGILTGNIGTIINSAKKLANSDQKTVKQKRFANEIATSFEVYTGNPSPSSDNYDIKDDDWIKNGGYDLTTNVNSLLNAAEEGKIKTVKPAELEQNASGFNLKALFKSDDKWELHGVAQINRADVNAVALGQWITFPIRSSMNLALRDVDYTQATEEAKFNRKRSFYPLEDMSISNKLPDSNIINGAAKKTIHKNSYPVYKTVPFIKQEYFNRIYWSKPNVADVFLNSYRMIYTDQYKEYNKEFGDITKILPLGNSLFVCFDHGMGVLPVDRSVKTETEASPYLASRNVLPAQVTTLSKDFGSMWKNSVLQTPTGLIYGVDTVGKKIWRTNGQNVEFISDHYVTKFLNDFINLSEFDHRAYQGHIDVKTHYNNFKHDVIFTFVKDVPKYKIPDQNKINELLPSLELFFGISQTEIKTPGSISMNEWGNGSFCISYSDGQDKSATVEIQNGKLYLNDVFTGVWCDIESWEKGTVWSLCYNEVLQKWTTFYDWYPIESCNVDNIFFTFDQEQIEDVYAGKNELTQTWNNEKPHSDDVIGPSISNKYFIDKTFTNKVNIYRYQKKEGSQPLGLTHTLKDDVFLSFYWREVDDKHGSNDAFTIENANYLPVEVLTQDGWKFVVYKVTGQDVSIEFTRDVDFCEVKFFNLPDKLKWENDVANNIKGYATLQNDKVDHLKYYEIRDYQPNRMLLWKHGQAGLYDNQGKIKPTHWYGKQHEFNFEFVVNENPVKQKIFNNLKILANKAAPAKFEYEVVGEGYEWFEYKPVVEWINKKTVEAPKSDPDYWWKYVLNKTSKELKDKFADFPSLWDEDRVIKKLPYLKMKHTDKKGTPERPHYKWDGGESYWDRFKPNAQKDYKYSYNCSEPCLVEDAQLNEVRLRTESLGNDIKKYGRIKGNMQYLEDLWNVEIRPVQIPWCYGEYGFLINSGCVIKQQLAKQAVLQTTDDQEIVLTVKNTGKYSMYVVNEGGLESDYLQHTEGTSIYTLELTEDLIGTNIKIKCSPNMTIKCIYTPLQTKTLPETRHRDKYIKVKVRYSGEDLALIQQIYTIFEESYA